MRVTVRAQTELTLDEAVAIAAHARAGTLETNDPQVRRLVGDANRLIVRTQLWGEAPTRRARRSRRWTAGIFVAVVLAWILGLLVPLLTHVGSW
jgi:hypothetical protein